MKVQSLVGISILAVVLLVLASLTNVIGYQTVQSSNQKIITTEINPKELLFQTIVDMANNKEIQKVILGSEITEKRSFGTDMRFSVFTPPVLTERFLKHAYTIGVILTKTLSKSKIQSILQRYQVSNQGVQKEINGVIEKDATLKAEMTQLSSLSCDCGNENTTVWHFPILCLILFPIEYIIWVLWFFSLLIFGVELYYLDILLVISENIGLKLNCFWA